MKVKVCLEPCDNLQNLVTELLVIITDEYCTEADAIAYLKNLDENHFSNSWSNHTSKCIAQKLNVLTDTIKGQKYIYNMTVIEMAIRNNMIELACELMERGADPLIYGRTPFSPGGKLLSLYVCLTKNKHILNLSGKQDRLFNRIISGLTERDLGMIFDWSYSGFSINRDNVMLVCKKLIEFNVNYIQCEVLCDKYIKQSLQHTLMENYKNRAEPEVKKTVAVVMQKLFQIDIN